MSAQMPFPCIIVFFALNVAFAQEIVVTDSRVAGGVSLTDAVNFSQDKDIISFEMPESVPVSNSLYIPDKSLSIGTAQSAHATLTGSGTDRLFFLAGATDPFTFANLTLTGGNGYTGGGVYAENKDLIFQHSMNVFRNAATGDGGGVYVAGANAYLRDGTSFSENRATVSGGGFYLQTGSLFAGNDVTIANNTAQTGGGGWVYQNVQAGDNVIIIDNTAIGQGGGLYIFGDQAVFGAGTRLEGNSSRLDSGGGIMILNSSHVSLGDSSRIVNNSASLSGGGMFVEKGAFTLGQGILVSGNRAETNVGGGFYLAASNLTVGEGAVFSGNFATTSGGAIWARDGNLTFADNASFTQNNATATRSNRMDQGGGGIHAVNGQMHFGNNAYFFQNTAGSSGGGILAETGSVVFGSNASFTDNAAHGGYGGAVALLDGKLTFAANSSFQTNNAALSGGAVFNRRGTVDLGVGAHFTGNRAGEAGGALFAGGGGTMVDATFSGNQSGLGGAVYAKGDFTVSGGEFTDNAAVSAGSRSGISGKGGAIFYDADGNSSTLSLRIGADGTLTIKNNKQGSPEALECNGIYFGNTENYADAQSKFSLDVAAGGEANMQDHKSSQGDSFGGFLHLVFDKTGTGIWRLSCINTMDSKTQWRISEGTFHLFSEERAKNPAMIHLNSAGSSFVMASGSHLAVTPFTSPFEIASPLIRFENGSTVGLADFVFGPLLSDGEKTVLELNSATDVENDSSIPVTEGTLYVGYYSYDYHSLRWEDAGTRLVVNIGPGTVSRDFTCVCSVTGPMAVALANQGSKLIFDRADLRLNSSDPATGCVTPDNGIWLSGSASHTDFRNTGGFSGYNLNDYTAMLGYDRRFGCSTFAGLATSYSRSNFSGGKTRLDADSYQAFLYGGARLPMDVDVTLLTGFGTTRFNQNRRAREELYLSKYDSHVLTAGAGIARSWEIFPALAFKPMATYEFLRLKTDAYNESDGYYGLTLATTNQSLHRVKAGMETIWKSGRWVELSAGVWYQGIHGDRSMRVPTYFTMDPEQNMFNNTGHHADRDSVGLGLNCSVLLRDNIRLGAEYTFIAGKRSTTHLGSAAVNISW